MTNEITNYVREECIPKLTSPVGVRYGVFRLDTELYEIRPVIVDDFDKDKPDYRSKQPVTGAFTSYSKAFNALNAWLRLHWDASDAAKLKSLKPAQRAALLKEVNEQTEEQAA